MGASVMEGDDLHIFVVAPASDVFVFNTQVWEVHVLVEVRQVVFERPRFDLARVAVGVAVVVFALPIALVQPFLVLALELVVEDHALDAGVTLFEPVGDAEIRLVDLRVVFELAFAFEPRIELLARVLVAAAVEPNGGDEPFLAQVAQVAAARIGFAPGVIAQVVRGYDAKAPTVDSVRVSDPRSVYSRSRGSWTISRSPTRQVGMSHEDVTRIAIARVSIALRPSLVIAITRVGFGVVAARARAAAKVRIAIIVVAPAPFPVARIVVAASRIVSPSRTVEYRRLR
jgi:hypothetical protein